MRVNFHPFSVVAGCAATSKPEAAYRGHAAHVKMMKMVLINRLTWVLLVAYTLLMFKPVMPILTDRMAHTFWEQQHLLTVHQVNGQFHLHNDLVNASHQSDKERQSNNKSEVEEYLPVAKNIFSYSRRFFSLKTAYQFYSCYYSFSFRDIDNPPPKA